MIQKDKTLNCSNCRIGDFKHSLCDCYNGFCAKYKGIGTEEDFFMAIEELSDEIVQGRWIPIREGLPEEHEWVGTKSFGTTISDKVHITFDVNGERFVRTLSLQNGELSNYEKRTMDTLYKGWKMIAWMPMPKPYKGGDDE